ncbi:ATP-binding protein [Paenibacillus koleovorans]|uniref:ATP-binding protein n=1 Tax=Paenibacillus koleovorans TaxID=121608 RepID=UPI000FDC2850|nr:ATP-binding protein [Paenibacillus koleovorans]
MRLKKGWLSAIAVVLLATTILAGCSEAGPPAGVSLGQAGGQLPSQQMGQPQGQQPGQQTGQGQPGVGVGLGGQPGQQGLSGSGRSTPPATAPSPPSSQSRGGPNQEPGGPTQVQSGFVADPSAPPDSKPPAAERNIVWNSYQLGDSAIGDDGIREWTRPENLSATRSDWSPMVKFDRASQFYWPNDYIWIRGRSLLQNPAGVTFLLLGANYSFELYAGNVLVAQYGGMTRDTFELRPVVPIFVDLPREYLQHELFMRVYSPMASNQLGKIVAGDRAGLAIGMVRSEWVEISIFFLFFVMGLVALILYFVNRDKPSNLYFALFALFISFNMLLKFKSLSLIGSFPIYSFYLREPLFGLTGFVFTRYFNQIIHTRLHNWINRFGTAILVGSLVIVAIKHGFEDLYIDYLTWLTPWYGIGYMLVCFGCLFLIAPFVRKGVDSGARLFAIGFSVFFLLSALGLPLRLLAEWLRDHWGISQTVLHTVIRNGERFSFVFMILYFGFHLIREYSNVYKEMKLQAVQLEEKNKDLRRMDELKDYFLANTSHELRTPLHGIIGLSESLAAGVAGELPESAKRDINLIASSGRRLASLVNDILDFSKLRHEDIPLTLKPIGMRQAVEVVMAMLRPLMRGKTLAFLNEIPADCIVLADEDRVQQMLYNLIGNAVKFTENGHVRVRAERAGTKWRIDVEDTGIGIAADRQKSIFESFEQADVTISNQYGGTGLGLSITKRLVELHGGDLSVESQPGRGSCFRFTLEASDEPAEQEESRAERMTNFLNRLQANPEAAAASATETVEMAAAPPNAAARSACILIVDDEPINLQVLSHYLSGGAYRVVQAAGAPQAMELLQQGLMPDLIILDVMMPRMTGFELCARIREEIAPKSRLPVLLLTAKNQVADLIEGFDAGANDYVTKPVSQGELLARVSLHLQLGRWNRSLEEKVVERTQAIRRLLDYAGQGFLSIDESLLVQGEYSSECVRIFGGRIEGEELPELIAADSGERQFLRSLLHDVIQEEDELQAEVLLSLLPDEAVIDGKTIKLQFRRLPAPAPSAVALPGEGTSDTRPAIGRLMVILSDVSHERRLEHAMEQERQLLKLVVRTVTFYKDFKELVHDFRDFVQSGIPDLLRGSPPFSELASALLREIHTFKGNFSQMQFIAIVEKLHKWETDVAEWVNRGIQSESDPALGIQLFREWLEQLEPLDWLEEDLQVLREYLGEQFDQEAETVTVEKDRLLQLERTVEDLLAEPEAAVILPLLKKLRFVPFADLLRIYPQHVERLARQSGKTIAPVAIEGPELLVNPDDYSRFTRSLIHVFQNMVVHGIEQPEERAAGGKPVAGRIGCEFETADGWLTLTIFNDGRPIDLARIREIALQRGASAMTFDAQSTEEQLKYIFEDAFSTRRTVSLEYGRGVGLSAVSQTVVELGGTIMVTSTEQEGTVFRFRLPIQE